MQLINHMDQRFGPTEEIWAKELTKSLETVIARCLLVGDCVLISNGFIFMRRMNEAIPLNFLLPQSFEEQKRLRTILSEFSQKEEEWKASRDEDAKLLNSLQEELEEIKIANENLDKGLTRDADHIAKLTSDLEMVSSKISKEVCKEKKKIVLVLHSLSYSC